MKRLIKIFAVLVFFIIIPSSIIIASEYEEVHPVSVETGERVYIIIAPTRDLNEFRNIVQQAIRLKPFGKVEVNISELADKGFHEIPPGRNSWYEYASLNPTPYKFFPDPMIAPFIPSDFVKKNRELLLSKAEILREHGLGAAFWSYEPNFLPREFFEKYPEMLGARVDHPRRSNHPAFAPCIDLKETQDMNARMITELLTNVPEIHTFFFKTNDAGSGICWSDWLYTGPNGPTHCKHISTGERMATLMNSFKKGAAIAGRDIMIYLTGSLFTDTERDDIFNHLPDNCYFQSRMSDEVKGIGSRHGSDYPVRGFVDPLEIIRNINSIKNETTKAVFINFRAYYDRSADHIVAIEKFMDIFVDNLKQDTEVTSDQAQILQICTAWAGKENAQRLADVFSALERANRYRRGISPRANGIDAGVSVRHITRPLVVAPDRLSAAEEDYFLPFVFNPSEIEARMDYTDMHGARMAIPSGVISSYVSILDSIIISLDSICETATEKVFLQNMVKSLTINKCIFRSVGNFTEAQVIRDRNAEKLSLPPCRPDKEITWTGDADLQQFNLIMRDELDNTLELIRILENGGMDFIAHAKETKYEDTFLLGPNLIEQLYLKRKIMLNHWTDIEGYMVMPLK